MPITYGFLFLLIMIPQVWMYRYIIMPGLGGSVLYNDKDHLVWPAGIVGTDFSPSNLGVKPGHVPDVFSSLRSIGDIDCIKIDTRMTYFFTKNIYYSTMIDHLRKRGHHVMAFPYDFRHVVHKDYYTQLYHEYKTFIEADYQQYHEPLIMIAHSAGGLLLHHFLTSFCDKQWVKKHISKAYYISVPFGGCPDALFFLMDAMAPSTHHLNIFKILTFIPNFHLCGGLHLCLPITNGPLLRKNGRWMYRNHVRDLLRCDPYALAMYDSANEICKTRKKNTGIPEVIVYGTGLNTTIFHDYDNNAILKGDGDCMVTTESLLYPQKYWKVQPSYVELRGKEHSNINNFYPMLEMMSQNKSCLVV